MAVATGAGLPKVDFRGYPNRLNVRPGQIATCKYLALPEGFEPSISLKRVNLPTGITGSPPTA